MDIVFYNVNEDGVAYEKHATLDDALDTLKAFPNDTIVVAFAGSPAESEYDSDLMRED